MLERSIHLKRIAGPPETRRQVRDEAAPGDTLGHEPNRAHREVRLRNEQCAACVVGGVDSGVDTGEEAAA